MKKLKLLPLSAFVSAVLYGTSFSVQAACLDTTQNYVNKLESGNFSIPDCVDVTSGNAVVVNENSVTSTTQRNLYVPNNLTSLSGVALLLDNQTNIGNPIFIGAKSNSLAANSLSPVTLKGVTGLQFDGLYNGYAGYNVTDKSGIYLLDGSSIIGTDNAINITQAQTGSARKRPLFIKVLNSTIDGNITVEPYNDGKSQPIGSYIDGRTQADEKLGVRLYFYPGISDLAAPESRLRAKSITGVNEIGNLSNANLTVVSDQGGSNWGEAQFLSLADSKLSFETNLTTVKLAPLLTVAKADIRNNEIKVKLNDLSDEDVRNNAEALSGGNEITFTLLAGQISSLASNVVKLLDARDQSLDFTESREPFNNHQYMDLVRHGSTTTSKLEDDQYKVTYNYKGNGIHLNIKADAEDTARVDSAIISDMQNTNDLKSINNSGNLEIDLVNGNNINWSSLTFNSGGANSKLALNITGVDENTHANFTNALLSVAEANIQNSNLTLKLSDYAYNENNSGSVLQGFNGVQLLSLANNANSTVGINSINVEDKEGKSLSAPQDTILADNIVSTHKNGALNLQSNYKLSYEADSYELTLDNTQKNPVPRLTTNIQSQIGEKNYTAVTNKGDAIIDVPTSGVDLGNASFSSANVDRSLTLSVDDRNISEALLKAASFTIANKELVIQFSQNGVTTQDIANKDYVLFEGVNGVAIDNDTEVDLRDNAGNSLLQHSDEIRVEQDSWQVANYKAGNLNKELQSNRYQIRYVPGQVEFLPRESRDAFVSLLPQKQESFIKYILDNKLDGTGSEADKLIRSAYTNAQARQLANEMMPDISGADINAAWVWGEQMRTHIENRTLAYRHQLPTYEREEGWNLWASSSLAHGKGGNDYSYSLNRYGLHIGMDRQINDEALIGFSAGMNRSHISPNNSNSRKKLTQLTFMPYVEWKGDLYFADANLIGGTYSVASERKIGNTTATGDYSGFQFGYQLTTGIDTELKGFALRPFVSLKQQWFNNEGWKESGSPFALTANTQKYRAHHAGIGVSLSKHFELGIGKLVPSLDIQYYKQLGGSDYNVNYRLASDITESENGKFTVNGITGNQFSTKLNASLSITENLNLSSSLSYNRFGNYKETAFGLSLSNTF